MSSINSRVKMNPYNGPILRNDGYYIHANAMHIGYAGNHKPSSSYVNYFNSKQQQASIEAKQEYINLFKNSVSSGSIDLLNTIFSNEDDFSNIDTQIKKEIEKALPDKKLEELMNLERDSLNDNSFKDFFDNAHKNVDTFNSLIENIAKASKLIGKEGEGLAVVLLNSLNKNNPLGMSNITLGQNLQKALNTFKSQNEGALISESKISHVVTSLNQFAEYLISSGGNSQKKNLTKEGLNTMIGNIFNTGFAEALGTIASATANMNFDDALIKMTGDQKVQSKIYKNGKEITVSTRSLSGKADSITPNVQMNLSYGIDNQKQGYLNFDLGISDKFYKTNFFPNIDKGEKEQKSQQYSSGALGMSLGDALKNLFGSDYDRYLSYNFMARSTQKNVLDKSQAIQNLIVKRYITKFFSYREGNQDFAQYMILNGQVVSIWEIILKTVQGNFGKSNSQRDKDQPLALSWDSKERAEALRAAKIVNAFDRIKQTNLIINNSYGLSIKLHLDKIKNIK